MKLSGVTVLKHSTIEIMVNVNVQDTWIYTREKLPVPFAFEQEGIGLLSTRKKARASVIFPRVTSGFWLLFLGEFRISLCHFKLHHFSLHCVP